MKVGACYLENNRCEFTLWAPFAKQVWIRITSPAEKLLSMEPLEWGYWRCIADDSPPGTQYFYQLDNGIARPDPASNFQPHGVHEASVVVDHRAFSWTDQTWAGIGLEEMIVYELHIGTFTPKGTFEAIIPRLKNLYELGINAIELMPIGQFPGDRNWGYDGVYTYAPQNSYGGVSGLKALINAAHEQGMAVILDVIYNHFGPEGDYAGHYGPYYTEKYSSAWGRAINVDGSYSYGVRNFFIENALYWFEQYHVDGLRLDASDTIFDFGAKHFLQELAETVHTYSQTVDRPCYLMAESDLNDVRVVRDIEQGGYGIDVQWNDGFHHCVHTLLTGERNGYYEDYGTCAQLAKAFKNTFVYSWDYSPHRNRWHGSDASDRPGYEFLVFIQNHDQIGNRMLGERFTHLLSFEALKLAAGTLLLAPNIPLLFMGEEYAEDAPFLYFVSHSDPELIAMVREGRKKDFAAFHLEGEYIDPESVDTFKRSQLNWEKQTAGKHKVMRDLYQQLIQLRRTIPALKKLDKQTLNVSVIEEQKLLFLHRWQEQSHIFAILNFNSEVVSCQPPLPQGQWQKLLDSAEPKWMGEDSSLPDRLTASQEIKMNAHSFAIYTLDGLKPDL